MVTAWVMLLASAAPALAADHLMKVGEVMLANAGGSNTVQFIELEDPIAEPFPFAPYVLVVYNAAGTAQTTYTLTLPNGTQRYTLATAQAQTDLGFTAQQTLTATLPTDGQACFRRNGGTPQNIHCFAWGTITTIIPGGTMNNGASPSNGMSVQRVGGTYVVAAPTPNAANSGGTVDMPMVDAPPVPDAGVMIDAPSTGTPDAPGGNPVTPKDDEGCSVGAGASWFGLVMLGVLLLVRRSSTRRR